MTLSPRDLDALRRALDWGRGLQRREAQLRLFPDTMPAEGTPAWFKLAQHMAALAQSHYLGLRPWQTPPVDADVADAATSDEIALLETMHDLGISTFEPDPPTTIADARDRQDQQALRAARRK
jgi:hypothetical protein